jgi:N-sulfoglucosamine sulfohydrolase
MYYPMRGVRTKQYKYIRNLFHELEYPHASDLWASKTWQGVLKRGAGAMVGRRAVSKYLHRPAEELYDITKDSDEVNDLSGSSSHKPVLEKLRRQVQDWRRQTKDPWIVLSEYKGEYSGQAAPRQQKRGG